jgi:hypothetical protein
VDSLAGQAPFALTFWRRVPGIDFAFLSPIFLVRGFRHEYLMVDDLHCLDLGVCARLAGHCMIQILKYTRLFKNDATQLGMERGVRRLSASLKKWYSLRAQRGRKKVSRVCRVTLKMLGYLKARHTGNFKAKGNETRHILPFCLRLMRSKASRALGQEGRALNKSMQALQAAYRQMERSGKRIDSQMLGLRLRSCAHNASLAGVALTPKFHLMRHFGQVAARAGNPRQFSCYSDESRNMFVVKTAQRAFRADFSLTVLGKEFLQRQIGRR